MAELSDIDNDFIRQEIEEYIERDDERQAMIDLYGDTPDQPRSIRGLR